MKIRQATYSDLRSLMDLFDGAKGIMRASGNLLQWNDGYPSEDVVLADISSGHCFVVCVMKHILTKYGFTECGVIYLTNGDPRDAYHLNKQ